MADPTYISDVNSKGIKYKVIYLIGLFAMRPWFKPQVKHLQQNEQRKNISSATARFLAKTLRVNKIVMKSPSYMSKIPWKLTLNLRRYSDMQLYCVICNNLRA